jgi:hypothetical protein
MMIYLKCYQLITPNRFSCYSVTFSAKAVASLLRYDTNFAWVILQCQAEFVSKTRPRSPLDVFSLRWAVAHSDRYCQILTTLTKHILWYQINTSYRSQNINKNYRNRTKHVGGPYAFRELRTKSFQTSITYKTFKYRCPHKQKDCRTYPLISITQ